MQNNLDLLLSEGIIDEVLGRLKSGKEADVFCVRYRGEIVAAKVYKDRQQRSFKNNAAYKEGRKVRNSRTQRAMDKGSRFGRDESEDAWKSSEASALQVLYTRGVRVPTPVMFYEGVLLMQLVTDAEGEAAPRLIDAPILPEHAGALYRDLRGQIIAMLCCDLIHGDLSPYNVLLGAAGPTIIDFPQTISAAHNNQSETFFRRDLDNILNFLAGLDRRLFAHRGDAREIWRAYTRRDLTPDFVPAAIAREERVFAPPAPQGQQRGRGYEPPPDRGYGPPPDRGGRPTPDHGGRPALDHGGRPALDHGGRPAPDHGGRPAPAHDGRPAPNHGGRPAPNHGGRPMPGRSGPRPPQQASRGPVVVYVNRSGSREGAPRVEVAPVQPVSPPQAQTPQAQAPQAEGGGGPRRRRRRH